MQEVKFTSLSIDNSVFKSYKYNFEDGFLKYLNQFKISQIEFILPHVIWGEIKSHLIAETVEAARKINDLIDNVISKNYFPNLKEQDFKLNRYFSHQTEYIALNRLNEFKKNTGLKLINEKDNLDIEELLKGYFSNKSPFETREKKKYEFPDAIALYALENYAKQNNKFILLVSTDEGWINYCNKSKYLYCERKISDALDLITKQSNVNSDYIISFINNFIINLNKQGNTFIPEDAIQHLLSEYEYDIRLSSPVSRVEPSVLSASASSIHLQDIDLIQVNLIESTFTINVELALEIELEVSFELYDYDFEDNYENYIGTTYQNPTIESNLQLVQTYTFDQYDLVAMKIKHLNDDLYLEEPDLYFNGVEPYY